MCQHLTIARVAEGLGVSWNTANNAVLAEGKRVLIDDAGRFDEVTVIGVDEHVWRHTRRGDKYVTVIIDLTGIREGTGPARLLDMVEGRSKQAFKTWLAEREESWRQAVEVVAMDGFTGFKTATSEGLPDAVAVMDPFHVVRLGGEALDKCRRRVQLDTCGHRGRKTDPLYAARRTLQTGADLLTDKQKDRQTPTTPSIMKSHQSPRDPRPRRNHRNMATANTSRDYHRSVERAQRGLQQDRKTRRPRRLRLPQPKKPTPPGTVGLHPPITASATQRQ